MLGEQAARAYYEVCGIRTISLRIGDLNDENRPSNNPDFTRIWLSHRDALDVFTKAIVNDPDDPTPVYFAISGNESIYDITPTMQGIGYAPLDNPLR